MLYDMFCFLCLGHGIVFSSDSAFFIIFLRNQFLGEEEKLPRVVESLKTKFVHLYRRSSSFPCGWRLDGRLLSSLIVSRLASHRHDHPPLPPPPLVKSKLSSIRKKVRTSYRPLPASQGVPSRMQLTLHAARRTPHGASRVVHTMSTWSVKK